MPSAALDEIIARYRDSGLFTHAYCAAGLLAEPTPRVEAAHLPAGREVFDLASLTKAMATTCLAFQAIRRGELGVDLPLPALDDLAPGFRGLRLRDVLRHETGLPAWRNLWVCRLAEASPAAVGRHERIVEMLNRCADGVAPGAPELYSDVGFLLLGLCLERLLTKHKATPATLQTGFDAFCRDELGWEPSPSLGFGPALPDLKRRAVTTGWCAVRRRELCGEVHDENCASLGGIAGHAGLFGTGPAVASFLHALAASPTGKALIAANAAARTEPSSAGKRDALMGWRQGNGPNTAVFHGGRAIGHPGFTGTAFWVGPEAGTYAIVLTNRVVSGRVPGPAIAAFRRDVLLSLSTTISTWLPTGGAGHTSSAGGSSA